ncbi:helix-turn-helix transcriptional regulator [Glutamicibacter soli]|uniref:helix-turn-helix transcriptional regulator n=1 Tax=Glutamicibacter soli TaxID=453836 RepID=UPI003FD4FD84
MSIIPELRVLPVAEELHTVHLSLPELAKRLNVKESTIYAWRHKQYGPPAMQLGRQLRWRLSDVVAWENAQIEAPRNTK